MSRGMWDMDQGSTHRQTRANHTVYLLALLSAAFPEVGCSYYYFYTTTYDDTIGQQEGSGLVTVGILESRRVDIITYLDITYQRH